MEVYVLVEIPVIHKLLREAGFLRVINFTEMLIF